MAVWVVQEVPGRNVLPAKKFGALQTLLGAHQQIVVDSGSAVQLIQQKLATFCEDDYLLAIGDPAAIGIACAAAAQANAGRFKILKWDRQEREYYPVQITLN